MSKYSVLINNLLIFHTVQCTASCHFQAKPLHLFFILHYKNPNAVSFCDVNHRTPGSQLMLLVEKILAFLDSLGSYP